MENKDTIVAVSTGASSGAISIVRMSGENAISIADSLFVSTINTKPSEFAPRMLTLGKISTKSFDEQAMCVVFKAPKSFTGEDMVEFQCHGGTQIANGVMRECIAHGARIATNGEFTKRAFLNGKVSLSSAEGMMDMINAESDAEVRAGYQLLSGNLSKLAYDAQKELTDKAMSALESLPRGTQFLDEKDIVYTIDTQDPISIYRTDEDGHRFYVSNIEKFAREWFLDGKLELADI